MSQQQQKQEKPQEMRLKESIHLLHQLKQTVGECNGYLLCKQQMSEWVKTGKPWEDMVEFPHHRGIVVLPRYTNRVADIQLKAKK